MLEPELLTAAGGFAIGVFITRVTSRIRIARLAARLEAAEFEAGQLREQLSTRQAGYR